jgi:hypothetical protein
MTICFGLVLVGQVDGWPVSLTGTPEAAGSFATARF